MAFIHGKDGFVSLGGVDLSSFSNSIEWEKNADSHDVTTFGKQSHVKQGGLFDGAITLQGVYDDGITSPESIIEPMVRSLQTLIYRPEGTGTGKPQRSQSVLVQKYKESEPVADMVTWEVTLEPSGDVTKTTQP